jgi:hypothetical protein
MKVFGEATLNAPVPEVYAALIDPAMLVRTIPGCQRLEQVGTDSYRATVTAGVASIKGIFSGEVHLTDQNAPNSFTLRASGAGAPGTVNAVARVALADAEAGATLLRYEADATIGGVIGGVGQRMLTGVARKTAAEFFAAVDRELAGAVALAGAGAGTVATGTVATGGVAAGGVAAGGVATGGVALTPGEAEAGAQPAAESAGTSGAAAGGVWARPAPVIDPARQRVRDLLVGAAFGAVVALLGVIVGAIVAGW